MSQYQVAVTNHSSLSVSVIWVNQITDPVALKFEIQDILGLTAPHWQWDATDMDGGWLTGSEI